MKLLSVAAVLGCVFVAFLLQLLGAVAGPAAAVLIACAVGLIAAMLSRALEFENIWLAASLATAGSALGVLLSCLNGGPVLLWLSPPVAFGAAAVFALASPRPRQHCTLCGKSRRDALFTCPRCSQTVCNGDDCWNYDFYRCRRCEEQRVPMLPRDRAWWRRRLGEPARQGHCRLCQNDDRRAELFACGHCGRLHCCGCWDYANGQCTHCAWVIPELPESLRNRFQSQK